MNMNNPQGQQPYPNMNQPKRKLSLRDEHTIHSAMQKNSKKAFDLGFQCCNDATFVISLGLSLAGAVLAYKGANK